MGGVSTASSATGGIGSSSACTAGSWATWCAGVSSGACAGTSGAGAAAGFGAALGTAGTGLGAANILAQVFFAAVRPASTTGFMASGVASGACTVSSSFLVSLDSSGTVGVSHAADSVVGTDPAAARGPLAAPPRPPRIPPRPRSVPRPPRPPRPLSTPRRAPSGRPRRLDAPSMGTTFSLALERDLSFAFFGTSENCETAPVVH
ncbi:hypothetical protein IG631_00234 [Alternaria alternata]|nr:hypothetical protein IG631_00234 [Alternaria alternata]